MKLVPIVAVAIAAIAAAPAIAAAQPSLSIDQFVGTPRTLYVETGGNWYQADLAKACWELPDANHVHIALGPDGRLDNKSTVMVHRESCPVASVTSVDGPPIRLLLNPNG